MTPCSGKVLSMYLAVVPHSGPSWQPYILSLLGLCHSTPACTAFGPCWGSIAFPGPALPHTPWQAPSFSYHTPPLTWRTFRPELSFFLRLLFYMNTFLTRAHPVPGCPLCPPPQVDAFLLVLRATCPGRCFLPLHWAFSVSDWFCSGRPPTQTPSERSQAWHPHWAAGAHLPGAETYLDLPYLMALGLASSASEENKKAESHFWEHMWKIMLKYSLKINVQPNKCMKRSPTKLSWRSKERKRNRSAPETTCSLPDLIFSHPPKDSYNNS